MHIVCLSFLVGLIEIVGQTDIFSSFAEIPKQFNISINKSAPIEGVILNYQSGGLLLRDLHLLEKYYSQSNSLFEFGVGKSTELAAYFNIPRYTGVDSSTVWLQKVAGKSPPHFRFYWADIGATKEWGFPVDKSGEMKYPYYGIGALSSENKTFDFYMVDGRFRVACVIASFLHASKHNTKPDQFLVGLHDFAARHDKEYKIIRNISRHVGGYHHLHKENVVYGKGVQLTIFRRNEDVSDDYLTKLWHHYKYIPH